MTYGAVQYTECVFCWHQSCLNTQEAQLLLTDFSLLVNLESVYLALLSRRNSWWGIKVLSFYMTFLLELVLDSKFGLHIAELRPSTCVFIQQTCLRIRCVQGTGSGPPVCIGCVWFEKLQFVFCVNDLLCLLLEITFVTQTYSNTREVYICCMKSRTLSWYTLENIHLNLNI